MRRLALALALLPALACAQDMVTRDGVTLTPAQEAQAEDIGGQLRCLVCQNESVEDSQAKLAGQLRTIIRQQVAAGTPPAQIQAFMVQRYGDFILLKPPFSPLTALLYAMPVLALVLGALGFWAARRRAAPAAPLTAAEQARLEDLL
jgi:cytochrome c-type biogenesis protein CcmH